MAYLIDTDTIIYGLKGDRRVRDWMVKNQNVPKSISVITFGELIYGAKKSKNPEKNIATTKRVTELFPIIEISKGIIEVFGEMKAKLEQEGTRIDDMDLLIAAIAIYMDLSLVTNNKNHFSRINDLTIENWEDA
jgi:tRNA(fMet)-specific endonuclease VapC